MKVSFGDSRDQDFGTARGGGARGAYAEAGGGSDGLGATIIDILNGWLDMVAPCPWNAHVGLSGVGVHTAWPDQPITAVYAQGRSAAARRRSARPLYTPAERERRDSTPWTMVQAVLAPIQFLVFAVSLGLILRYMLTGQGYALATGSILVKTALLYTIMITGSIWEKVVFGKWLFARSFFWEDVFSMLVLGLQSAYLASLLMGWGSADQQMLIAVAAYGAYAINAAQFLLKLRAARLEGAVGALPGVAA